MNEVSVAERWLMSSLRFLCFLFHLQFDSIYDTKKATEKTINGPTMFTYDPKKTSLHVRR